MARSTSCLLAAALAISTASTTDALTINATFNSSASDAPSYDSDGSKLIDIMNYAVSVWEDIIQDPGTLEVEFYYDNLSDANGTLGLHNNLATSGGKPTSARIRLDTQINGNNRLWYFDSTPEDNSEYDIEQTLYRDLSASNQSNWFRGSPPDLLEVGYRGDAKSTSSSTVRDGYDMLSTVIHELGHAVGLTGNVSSGEYADGDYDIPTSFVNGNTMAVEGDAHIDPRVALMCGGCGATGLRRLPTAIDVLAAATGAGWTNIDLLRQDMLSGGNMRTDFEWIGNAVPGAFDDAWVRHGAYAYLSNSSNPGSFFAKNLWIGEGSEVDANGNKIDVGETITVNRSTGDAAVQLFVDTDGEIESMDLIVQGAELDLNGGLVDVGNDLDILNNDGFTGLITGNGTIDVADRLYVNGRIVPDGGTLVFDSVQSDAWDIDGAGNGELDATSGNIHFASGGVADAFDGVITVGADQYVQFDVDWELGTGGVLNLNGGASLSDTAEIRGTGTTTLSGVVNVDGHTEIDTPVIVESTATVNIPDPDDRLDLGNNIADSITYNGGVFTGTGTLVQDGDATVTSGATVTIQTDTFDFDGDTISDTTLETNSRMDITGTGLKDAHDGIITIQSGAVLNVNTRSPLIIIPPTPAEADAGDGDIILPPLTFPVAWTLSGTLDIQGGTLEGSRMIVGDGTPGTVTASSGTGTINAPVTFTGNSVSQINSTLDLAGTAVYEGGTHTGTGALVWNSNIDVTADTIISVTTIDMDGDDGDTTITVDQDATLTLNLSSVDYGFTPTFNGSLVLDGGGFTLNKNSGSWNTAGTITLNNPDGAHVPEINGSKMNMTAGGLIQTAGSGDSRIDADLEINGGSQIDIIDDTILRMRGDIIYDGGSVTGDGVFQQDANATVNSATVIEVARYDMDGAAINNTTVAINAPLTINSESIERTGTNNDYNDSIVISPAGSLTVNTLEPWSITGAFDIDATGKTTPVLDGQDVAINGTATVDGNALIEAIVDIGGAITLTDGTAYFMLQEGHFFSPNLISGGTVDGTGFLAARHSASLFGYGEIASKINFYPGSYLLADDGTLNITGEIVSMGVLGTNDADGVLHLANAFNTGLATGMELNGGSVTGATLTNETYIGGHGTIATLGLVNNGTITADGGLLVIDTINLPDIDGTGSENGILNAELGSIRFVNNASYFFNGKINIAGSNSFVSTAGAMVMSIDSSLSMDDGFFIAPEIYLRETLITAGTQSVLDGETTFRSTSSSTINNRLQLAGPHEHSIESGAVFSGSGEILVSHASTLSLLDGSDVGIEVINDGALRVGSSPGVATVNEYRQTVDGVLVMELDGLNPGTQYDQLYVNFDAYLAGYLLLDVSFVPDYGDKFLLMETDGGDIFDTFDAIKGLEVAPSMSLAVIYDNLQNVIAIAALPGDANLDGKVDLLDLSALASSFGDLGTWASGDFDGNGKVDLLDLSILAGNFGQTYSIPEPAAAAIMTLGLVSLRRRSAA
ncbi:hypothetical protein [Mucisphaera calidilacus]|uniref:Dockerin domain-containing protein n=1 Tax=Mucisphaera calidilacus TaxID=2527982 RepID=A0A518BVH2_9BACT|nr:hypothetical protein [Mucisphaera calidilacus]QDU70947.1 hypothetical protein Pan265_07910 [Mucisphaera calidilacus]